MNMQHSHAEQQGNHGISLTLFMLNTPLTEGQHLRVAVSHTEILLSVHSRRILGSNVTANTIPGFTRNSAPFWARGEDAFLVIYGARIQAHLAHSVELCKGSAIHSFCYLCALTNVS